MTAGRRERVLLTDHPWPDVELERSIIEGAGYEFVVGPVAAEPADVVEQRVRDCDPVAILTCWAQVSAAAIRIPQKLAIVGRMGVGLDNIAVSEATARGAWVTNVPDYCTSEVSDHAIGLVLAHFRNITRLDAAVKSTGWKPDGAHLERIGDLTVGIIGYGRIGRETARKLSAFGCRVIAFSPSFREADSYAGPADIAAIQAQADVIILHAPLNAKTQSLVDAVFIDRCATEPLLVNVSRGGLVDNAALIDGLNSGKLRGAALDVVEGEPNPPAEVTGRSDVIVTPHVAFISVASLIELRRRACEEAVRVLRGEAPMNPCNTPAPASTALEGGVSSDIRIVEGPDGPIVVKRALAKLKVAADWFSDPARSTTEVAAIETVGELIGEESVPKILWVKPDENAFAMRLVDPRLRNWKTSLLAGQADARTAHRAGVLLGRLHASSAGRDDIRRRFADTTYFEELRIEPFFTRVAAKRSDIGAEIAAVAQAMRDHAGALVHGDYSPKNILADGGELVILDYEVAHWGDPRFDIAFCATHLLLKASRAGADRAAIARSLAAFLDGYGEQGPRALDEHLTRIAGCLVLARIQGASPVDYIGDLDIAALDGLAQRMITAPAADLKIYMEFV